MIRTGLPVSPSALEGVFQPGFDEAWPKNTPIFPSDRKRLLVCVMTCSCPCLLVGVPVSGNSPDRGWMPFDWRYL